jgi:hypothetical protein
MLKCGFLNKGRGITREQAVPVTYPQPPDNKEAKKSNWYKIFGIRKNSVIRLLF